MIIIIKNCSLKFLLHLLLNIEEINAAQGNVNEKTQRYHTVVLNLT